MKEKLMVRGKKYWVADKNGKVLVSHHDTPEAAKKALANLEQYEKEEGYYVPGFYKIVDGVLGALRLKGYTSIEDIMVCSDIIGR